jgi:hypothetical protein
MRNLKAAYKEVLTKELEGRTKGKTMDFEDGLKNLNYKRNIF